MTDPTTRDQIARVLHEVEPFMSVETANQHADVPSHAKSEPAEADIPRALDFEPFAAHAILPLSYELRDDLVADLRTVARTLDGSYANRSGFRDAILSLTRWADLLATQETP